MFEPDQYELVDFGGGQKLERFSAVLVNRPCPLAVAPKRHPEYWDNPVSFTIGESNLVSPPQRGQWSNLQLLPNPWLLKWQTSQLLLKPTPFGHLGIFPEQESNWSWILDLPRDLTGLTALNLFAYTGATTLALAHRGVAVTHVDSSRSVVNWARENAIRNGLADAPIRWIVDDATKFVRREAKRGRQYDILVLDPPSFGRGIKNETWKIQKDLAPLLASLATLCRGSPYAMILSSHTPEFSAGVLLDLVRRHFGPHTRLAEPYRMSISASDGRSLNIGDCVRWFQN